MSSEIDTPAKRARLEARRNPYWQGVAGGRGGVTLGYRRAAGAGTWVAKAVIEKRRVEERIGLADDKGTADAIPFKQAVAEALAWGRRQVEAFEARDDSQRSAKAPTVRSAIEAYVRERLRRGRREGRDAERRLTKHVLAFPPLADLPLAKLRAKSLERWREQLAIRNDDDTAGGLRPATVNRMMNDLRAALNSAVERHRRELPAHVMLEVKIGTRSLPSATRARKQSLTDDDIASLLREAWALDEDFGRLVLVLASTGCRYSQAAKIRVADVQEANGRILVPCSQKGQGAKGAKTVAVPVSPDVLRQLRPAIEGRSPGEFLLTHWHLKQVGPGQWVREKRSAWKQNEMTRPWAKIREAAGFDTDVVAYGLRHASIIRGLKAGLPIRLVGAIHNTSSAMIEQHYGAYILDMSEELARRAMVDFGSRPAGAASEDQAA